MFFLIVGHKNPGSGLDTDPDRYSAKNVRSGSVLIEYLRIRNPDTRYKQLKCAGEALEDESDFEEEEDDDDEDGGDDDDGKYPAPDTPF